MQTTRTMHGRSLLLLAAMVVAAAGTPVTKGPDSDGAAKYKPSVTEVQTSEVPLKVETTSAKPTAAKVTTPAFKRTSMKSVGAAKVITSTLKRTPTKSAGYRRRLYLNHPASKSLKSEPSRQEVDLPVAGPGGRPRLPSPRPRQFQPTIGDLLGVYAYPTPPPLLGHGVDMGRRDPYLNTFPHFNPGFNPGEIPPQFQGFNNPKPFPYFHEQWPFNPLPQHHLNNRYPLPQHDMVPQFLGQNPETKKFIFDSDQFSTLVNLPIQLTSLMQKVGVKAFSLKLKEWLQQLPVQTQPPIDGKLLGAVGCDQGTPSGQQQGQNLGGKGAGSGVGGSQGGGGLEDEGRPLKVEATKMESGFDEVGTD